MTTTAPPRPAAPAGPPSPPSLGRRVAARLLRWWRQLTAMRTALMLLFLLALAAIPGSLLPQRSLSQSKVTEYFRDHPSLAPVLDRLYLFDVFGSPWFSAVYLLLFISLIGCIVPRAVEYARSVVAAPPPAPRHLRRLPEHTELRTTLDGDAALDVVEEELRVRRFRVVRRTRAHGPELSAEKGHLKEAGNLLFHVSLLAILVALAGGKMFGYEGSIVLTEGDGFCNSFQNYDTYSAGPLVQGSDLGDLCVDLRSFQATYEDDLTAASFSADIDYGPAGSATRDTTISVNHPLRTDGDRVYVTGHGFSPCFTVTLPDGTEPATDECRPFLPTETRTMSSEGVLKLPDLGPGQTDQLAVAGFFAPTGVVQGGLLTSIDPRPLSPQVAVQVFRGYLGLDSGIPQSVYQIDQTQVERGRLVQVGSANLTAGESFTLDDGTRVTFTGVREFAAIQVSHDPGQVYVLIASIGIMIGSLAMLLLSRERVFARAGPGAGGAGTVLSIGSLTRGSGETGPRFQALTDDLQDALTTRAADGARRTTTPATSPDGAEHAEPEAPPR
ncbi:cytochrome c biogenesis protein ResB [Modestobacter sp. I12A-02628]|uniref:Cytochrome c biogenesis protein ResB n=1 Tax=Goekera deserti TaxID=2497753 RepID=A0A7K3W8N3_9ACTN|nr:cytochrome c biogenesis protein ResB [Goekera deserti]MPR00504.1 cytochrome c biogenesis protein ResB [Goekera deserti]NDI49097.1 cytochrome c biogenesis protein ResB [Goekera deserti]NEL52835.1 cytochrome c biogenesis protein ResB [Goekera deserti]